MIVSAEDLSDVLAMYRKGRMQTSPPRERAAYRITLPAVSRGRGGPARVIGSVSIAIGDSPFERPLLDQGQPQHDEEENDGNRRSVSELGLSEKREEDLDADGISGSRRGGRAKDVEVRERLERPDHARRVRKYVVGESRGTVTEKKVRTFPAPSTSAAS